MSVPTADQQQLNGVNHVIQPIGCASGAFVPISRALEIGSAAKKALAQKQRVKHKASRAGRSVQVQVRFAWLSAALIALQLERPG